MRLPTAPDNTGCNHDVREVFGIFQCNQCGRTFSAFAGVYSAEESRVAPERGGLESGVALREKRLANGQASAFTRAGIVSMAMEVARMETGRDYTRDEMYEATTLCYESTEAHTLSEMVEQLLDDSDKLESIRQMLDGLRENKSTSGVARRLEAILEGVV